MRRRDFSLSEALQPKQVEARVDYGRLQSLQWVLEGLKPSTVRTEKMFPSHCKEVSVKKVDFELTMESIASYLSGKRAYIRTRYYIFNRGDDWAVASVEKADVNGILQPITKVTVLSLPHETSFVEDASLEVLSASRMGRLREIMHTKCVVVRGKAEHISFFVEEAPLVFTVFDVVPPRPSKLVGLVESVLESDLQDTYAKFDVVEVDLNDLARTAGRDVMYPCRASGLKAEGRTLYLDETPGLGKEELKSVTLVGCSLSGRIFKAVYGAEPRLVNMCPQDLLRSRGVKGPALVKCCKVKEGFELKGEMAVVPWGARSSEVSAALKALFSQMSRSSSLKETTGHGPRH